MQGSAGLTLASLLPGCTEAALKEAAMPDGFEMPLESEPHERTFMQWPVNLDVYDKKSLAKVQASIALIAAAGCAKISTSPRRLSRNSDGASAMRISRAWPNTAGEP